MSSIIRSRDSI